MKNNAHYEDREKRLQRLINGSPIEAIETLLNSIDNFFNNEIRLTPNQFQTSLLFLGIHAVALTISEAFYNKGGESGYRLFLENFVDGEDDDKKFSKIASTIHDWRNILAHQWIGSLGHSIAYDYNMEEGWKYSDNTTIINPRIYCECYLNAFSRTGKLWDYDTVFTPSELNDISQRIIKKFEES